MSAENELGNVLISLFESLSDDSKQLMIEVFSQNEDGAT